VCCPRCGRPWEQEPLASGSQRCPRCHGDFVAVAFAPPERRVYVPEVGAGGTDETTACAAHKRNLAVATCSRCGVFLCAVCRVDLDRRVLCPACFDRLSNEDALATLKTRFRDYAGIAYSFAAFGIGPAAAYYAFRALRQRDERGDAGGRAGPYLAAGIGLLESAGLLAVLLSLVR
jgi:hypothetical protein